MNNVSDLRLAPLWLSPEHQAATARFVMTGHKVRAIGVIEAGALVGIVGFENLAGKRDEERLKRLMSPITATVAPTATLRSVAQLLAQENLEAIPVVESGQFLGIVTATDLLRELSRTWDPLTELSWSDRLREWGVERLKSGQELTILFLDLDDFGAYNKAHGHIVGDRVLQRVAGYLKESIDDELDVLVRYGGDEFAIGTIRTRAEAERLCATIQEKIAGTFVTGSERPVEISVGLFGGRRTQERENVHYAATLDSLINLASRDCLSRKARKKHAAAAIAMPESTEQVPPSVPEPASKPADETEPSFAVVVPPETPLTKPRVAEVHLDERSERGVVMVTLDLKGQPIRGLVARTTEMAPMEAVAWATFNAIERLDESESFRLSSVKTREIAAGSYAVALQGWRVRGQQESAISAEVEGAGDLAILVAEAAVQATNRR